MAPEMSANDGGRPNEPGDKTSLGGLASFDAPTAAGAESTAAAKGADSAAGAESTAAAKGADSAAGKHGHADGPERSAGTKTALDELDRFRAPTSAEARAEALTPNVPRPTTRRPRPTRRAARPFLKTTTAVATGSAAVGLAAVFAFAWWGPGPDNAWVAVERPEGPAGRASAPRSVASAGEELIPFHPYEIQQHEVTWSELSSWLDARGASVTPPEWVPASSSERARLPATGVSWKTARAFCRDLGGRLPSEAEWSFAARGPEHRRFPWGNGEPGRDRTPSLSGSLRPVTSTPRDRTPGPRPIFDLLGNAREWTQDVWSDASWTRSEGRVYRTVRGAPLRAEAGANVHLGYREPVCTGPRCPGTSARVRETVGFRCVR
jgi:hypothetical protein